VMARISATASSKLLSRAAAIG